MSKNEIRRYIILAVILVVFSVIAFAAPFTKNAVFWISYLFGVIAIAFQIYVFKIAFADGADTKSKFYGFPIARVGVIYLCAQIVLSLIQMGFSDYLKTWISVIVNILPIAFAVIGTVAADVVREEVERQEVKVKRDVSNMRSLQAASAALAGICSNASFKKKLEDLADQFKYSDPVSSDETIQIELKLQQDLEELKNALKAGENAEALEKQFNMIKSDLQERNSICTASKK